MTYSLNLVIEEWVVYKNHIEKIVELFKSRFPGQSIKIEIRTSFRNGEATEEFESFKKFDAYMEKDVFPFKKEVLVVKISSHNWVHKIGLEKHAWLDIEFRFSEARLHIDAQGNDKVKDWADGFYSSMESLMEATKPNPELIQHIKKKHSEKFQYKKSTIFLDYYSEEKPVSETSLSSNPQAVSPMLKESFWNTLPGKIIEGIIVAGIVAMLGYLLSLIF